MWALSVSVNLKLCLHFEIALATEPAIAIETEPALEIEIEIASASAKYYFRKLQSNQFPIYAHNRSESSRTRH